MSDWPHSPLQRTLKSGTYMVTAATYQKTLHFTNPGDLKFLHDTLLLLAKEHQWKLQAWAVFANHYHFIAQSPQDPKNLPAFLSHLHETTAKHINDAHNTPNRKVWCQYWDNHVIYQNAYLARLNYVNQNPVRHGLVSVATDYPWCSASWFQETTSPSFYKMVGSFKTDKMNIIDDF